MPEITPTSRFTDIVRWIVDWWNNIWPPVYEEVQRNVENAGSAKEAAEQAAESALSAERSAEKAQDLVKMLNTQGAPDATETVKGISTISTDAQARAGTDDTTQMTPLKTQTAISVTKPAAHEHTKSEIGLSKVDNTADADKNVKYATSAGTANAAAKLSEARTISLTGVVTGSASFDGSANASIETALGATVAPVPVSGTGTAVGTWKAWTSNKLPSDGKWAYTGVYIYTTGSTNETSHTGYISGVADGGKDVVPAVGTLNFVSLLVWRIA